MERKEEGDVVERNKRDEGEMKLGPEEKKDKTERRMKRMNQWRRK